jgi:hypothetical protein
MSTKKGRITGIGGVFLNARTQMPSKSGMPIIFN